MIIQSGRYVTDDDLIDGAIKVCDMFDYDAHAYAEGRPTKSKKAWTKAVADPNVRAAYALLTHEGGPLEPYPSGDPDLLLALMYAWQTRDRATIREILERRAATIFPTLCPDCRRAQGSPHQH